KTQTREVGIQTAAKQEEYRNAQDYMELLTTRLSIMKEMAEVSDGGVGKAGHMQRLGVDVGDLEIRVGVHGSRSDPRSGLAHGIVISGDSDEIRPPAHPSDPAQSVLGTTVGFTGGEGGESVRSRNASSDHHRNESRCSDVIGGQAERVRLPKGLVSAP